LGAYFSIKEITKMADNPQTPLQIDRHYLYDDATRIIYYCDEIPEDRPELIYIGQSDNPYPEGAAAYFMQHGKISSGFRLRELT
jgi:hypothetical protein